MPEYQLTPQAIFQNDILAFDINFFSPKPSQEVDTGNITETNVELNIGTKASNADYYQLTLSEYNQFKNTYGFDTTSETNTGKTDTSISGSLLYAEYEWTNSSDNQKYTAWVSSEYTSQGDKYRNITKMINYTRETRILKSPASDLQSTISSWYKTLRNLALVALLSILVYIGIRITLSSVASDKAKYKQMLVDWTVALCLVFLMHYIMSFAVTINEKLIDAMSSINTAKLGTIDEFTKNSTNKVQTNASQAATTISGEDKNNKKEYVNSDDIDEEAVQLFRIVKGADKAWEVLVGDDDDALNKSGVYSRYYNRFENPGQKGQMVLYWPAYDFMSQARLLGQGTAVDELNDMESGEDNEDQEAVVKAGYNIIYVVLVIFTVIFCFTYLKRVIYMAFLTIIAPLVALTYPIDKINDGSAQAFNMWLKEYIFNLLIQPMHLLLYTILVGSAMGFAADNIFYVVVALGFMVPAEKLLRKFFGFEKAQTPGMFAGPAGAALMMSGINKLMHKPPKDALGPGGKDAGDDADEENAKISTYKNGIDPIDELLGDGGINVDFNGSTENQANGNGNSESNTLPYHPSLNQEQINELKSAGVEPGDQEYNMYLKNHGINLNSGNNTGENGNGGIGNINTPFGNGNTMNINFANNNAIPVPKTKKKIVKPKRRSIGRGLHRGLDSYREGMVRRYKANKKKNGGLLKRGIRMASGVAVAGTLATAGGIIGIASGDVSKVAQYMAAGAAGGYALGKAGANKAVDTAKEQYKEPLKESKIGYYGEDEYKKRKHEKWKKEQLKNGMNISRVQDIFNVDRTEAEQITKDILKYTDNEGINSIEDAIAVKQLQEDSELNLTEEEAIAVGSLAKIKFGGGSNIKKMKTKEKEDHQLDLKEKFMMRGLSENQANEKARRTFNAVAKFGNLRSALNYNKSEKDTSSNKDE